MKKLIALLFLICAAPTFAQMGSAVNPMFVRSDTSNGGIITTQAATSDPSAAITPIVGSLVSSISKASPSNLYSVSLTTGASAGYIYVFNAIAAPADGAVVAGTASGQYMDCAPVAATTRVTVSYDNPDRAGVGVTLVFSTSACGTLTKSATAVFLKIRAM